MRLQRKSQNSYQESNNRDIAFWAKGSKVYEVDEKHIRFILDNPELFGLTREEVIATYRKYHEKIGQEGKAREEIIRRVSEDGWIRVRHYTRPKDYWTIQFDEYRKRKRSIEAFIDYATDKAGMGFNDAVSLLGYKDGFQLSYTYQEGGVSNLFENRKRGVVRLP